MYLLGYIYPICRGGAGGLAIALRRAVCVFLLLHGALVVPNPARAACPEGGTLEGSGHASGRLMRTDAEQVIAEFREGESSARIALWSRMTVATDARTRAEAVRSLPPAYAALRVTGPDIESALGEVLRPLLRLYGKQYEIFVIRHRVPMIETDSHAVLVMTTGFLDEVRSDDELLTCVAHEIAHEVFRDRREALRREYAELADGGRRDSAEASGVLRELSLIELECDAVATRSVSHLRYNPTAFPEMLERIAADFPEETAKGAEMGENIHPPACLRALVISALAGEQARVKPRASRALRRVEAALKIDQAMGSGDWVPEPPQP